MAKEDPESSLAEDRAWDVWSNDDSSGEARQFFRLEDREDVWEHIFRQGFRAGQEHGRQSPPVLGTYANHARRLADLESDNEHQRSGKMIDYSKTSVGDILKIVGAGAPGYAQLGDLVRVTRVDRHAVEVEDKRGVRVEFLYNCGAARLEATEWKSDFPDVSPKAEL